MLQTNFRANISGREYRDQDDHNCKSVMPKLKETPQTEPAIGRGILQGVGHSARSTARLRIEQRWPADSECNLPSGGSRMKGRSCVQACQQIRNLGIHIWASSLDGNTTIEQVDAQAGFRMHLCN